MARTRDPRLREIMISLVSHLHAFVRDIRLTEPEFREATALLSELGRLSTDNHNETVLMAGSLGVSSLVCLLNNGDGGQTETSQSLLGPFWRLNSPRVENGGSIVRSETPGPPLFVSARVVDRDGQPVAGAEVDVWHASPVGLYENQDPGQAEMNLRGKFLTDDNGRFSFRSVMMVGYPIPTDGVVGRLLEAQGRHPFRPRPPARARLQDRLQDARFANLRSRRSAYRRRRAVRRDARADRRFRAPSGGSPDGERREGGRGSRWTTFMSWSRARRRSPSRRSNSD